MSTAATKPRRKPSGVADNITATPSTNFNIQVNGNLPTLTTVAGIPQGDQLNLTFPSSVNVFSDNASPPNVTLTGQTALLTNPFGVKSSSIERLNVSPGNGVLNIIGDNTAVGGNQDDYFKVRGGVDPLGVAALGGAIATNGVGQLSLQIGGSWIPANGAVDLGGIGPDDGAGLSSKIYFNGVTRINASGAAIASFDTNGNAIPDTTPSGTNAPAGTNALDITPYADNTPKGWGIETYWNQGNTHVANQNDAGTQNAAPDLLIVNGVSGVSENLTLQPSGVASGQVFDNNAATEHADCGG